MKAGPHSRFTIANVMLIIAGVALTMAVVLTPGLAPVLLGFAILTTLALIGGLLATRRILELVYGHSCPRCKKRGLERRAVLSFGERFFSCPACGQRCRRSLLGAYGLYAWSDASGPEFDSLFHKPQSDDPWNAPPGLEDEDMIYSKTHLNLVLNKRRRTPDNPNGPGLE
jgi:hypothetical protein